MELVAFDDNLAQSYLAKSFILPNHILLLMHTCYTCLSTMDLLKYEELKTQYNKVIPQKFIERIWQMCHGHTTLILFF